MIISWNLLFLCSLPTLAMASGIGSTTGAILEMAGSTRGLGLGNALTARASGAEALWYNPAGIGSVPAKLEVEGAKSLLVESLSLNLLSVGIRLSPKSGLGIGFASLTQDPLESFDNQGQPTGKFQASDRYLAIGLSRRLNPLTSIGLNVKYLDSKLGSNQARGMAMDAGFQMQVLKPLRLGVALKNLGSSIRYRSKEEPLPLKLALGIGFELEGVGIGLEMERNLPSQTNRFHVGTEFTVTTLSRTTLAFRVGYLSSLGNLQNKDLFPLNGGVGISFGRVGFDYGYRPFASFGSIHQMSMKIRWGGIQQ